MFIGHKIDKNQEFPTSYLELNVSPKNEIFVNRIENPFGNATDIKNINVEENNAGISHITDLGNNSFISKVKIPWETIYAS